MLSKNIGSKTGGYLQTVDFAYNHNGWLTTINGGSVSGTKANCASINPYASSNEDLFALDIRYNNTALANSTGRQNGNISEIYWQVKDRAKNAYQFQYDYLNRLTEANHFVPNIEIPGNWFNGYYDTNYSYDARGNIMSLSRNGLTGNGTACSATPIDNLTYMYRAGTNKLLKVFDSECGGAGKHINPIDGAIYNENYIISDAKTNTNDGTTNSNNIQFKANNYITLKEGFQYDINGNNSGFNATLEPCETNSDLANHGFKGAQSSYRYDGNGNLIFDSQKQLSIAYNHLNLPYQAEKDANNKIEWLYTADGKKLQKKATTNGQAKIKNYLGNMEFAENANGTNTLEAAYHSEGRVLNNNTWEYNLKDHLGNVRVVFKEHKDNNNAEIVQENHYYPFGMQLNGRWQNNQSVKNDYLYNGKELNTEIGLNWSDYGFRYYDATIGRFTAVDPLADIFHNIPLSPYHFVANNPINNIDPNGLDWYRNNETNEIHWQKGSNEVEGHTNIGAIYIMEGPQDFIIHNQNEVVGTVERNSNNDGLIFLNRTEEGSDFTIGEFATSGNDPVRGYMLEPSGPSTAIANQDQRIPEGLYDLDDYSSKKYPKNFILSNDQVSKDRLILIHTGNTGNDTAGCLLPGCSKSNGSVGRSTIKFNELQKYIKDKKTKNVRLKISNSINN